MSLPSSMAEFVPCDRLLQKAYLVFDQDNRKCIENNIWNFSSRVRLDISRVNKANEWEISSWREKKFQIYKQSYRVILLHKHTDVFHDFPKISGDQGNFFEHFPKIAEKDPMMFRSYIKAFINQHI